MAEVAGELDGLNWSAAAVGWLMLRGKPPAKAAVSQLPTAQACVSWYHKSFIMAATQLLHLESGLLLPHSKSLEHPMSLWA